MNRNSNGRVFGSEDNRISPQSQGRYNRQHRLIKVPLVPQGKSYFERDLIENDFSPWDLDGTNTSSAVLDIAENSSDFSERGIKRVAKMNKQATARAKDIVKAKVKNSPDSYRKEITTGKNQENSKKSAQSNNKSSKQSFRQAFKAARNAGLKEFTWNGDRFNTMTAAEKKAGATTLQNGKWVAPVNINLPNFEEVTNPDTPAIDRNAEFRKAAASNVIPTYRTNNTYNNMSEFRNNLRNLNIGSNTDLINWLNTTGVKGYDWGGNTWAQQFRSDVDKALGGNYSDANIRSRFNTAGNWGKGFLGSGDFSDFRNALSKYANTWSRVNWNKQGGQLVSRNPVQRFKQRNFI